MLIGSRALPLCKRRASIAVGVGLGARVALTRGGDMPVSAFAGEGRGCIDSAMLLRGIQWQSPSSLVMNLGNIEHPTSNSQHPRMTPHATHWMFAVGCWMLDGFSPVQGFNALIFRSILSASCTNLVARSRGEGGRGAS